MTILGQGGHFVGFSFFALTISETSNKHSDKFFSTFAVDKMSKPNFSRACIFLARCNSMAFAKVPSKDWPLSRKKKNQKNPRPNFRRLYLSEYWADFSETPPDWRYIHTLSKSVIKGLCPKKFFIHSFNLTIDMLLWRKKLLRIFRSRASKLTLGFFFGILISR